MVTFEALWQIVTGLKVVDGIMPLDVLSLPDPLGGLVRRLIRAGRMPLSEFAAGLNLDVAQAHQIGAVLIERGYLLAGEPTPEGEATYRVHIARMRRRHLSI